VLAPRPTPKLEDHPLSAVRDCLFNIFAATLHIWRPSPPSATWGRAMPWWQGTHLTWIMKLHFLINLVSHFSKLGMIRNDTMPHIFSWYNQTEVYNIASRRETWRGVDFESSMPAGTLSLKSFLCTCKNFRNIYNGCLVVCWLLFRWRIN
jgi:hypothetical protein